MPVSVWLNGNEKRLTNDGWTRLVLDFLHMFHDVFGFQNESVQLWERSFFEESDGILLSSNAFKELSEENSFESLIKRAFDKKLILKITGNMSSPISEKAFMVCFLESEDRWDMPHIFFDSAIGELDLVDTLWKLDDREKYAYGILDYLPHIGVEISGEIRRIVDQAYVSRDFPDKKTIREKGTALYYISGRETRFMNLLIRDYSSGMKERKKKISALNLSEVSGRLYDDQFFREAWEKISPHVRTVPGGSLALISSEEEGIPRLINGIEDRIIGPVLEEVPVDFLDSFLARAKSKIKFDESTEN